MKQLKYVGLDIHKATTVIVILNALGQFQKQVIIQTKAEALREFIQSEVARCTSSLKKEPHRPGSTSC